MPDDDLDRLLSDVDGDTDGGRVKPAGAEIPEEKDKSVPPSGEEPVSAPAPLIKDGDMLRFRAGIVPALKAHLHLAEKVNGLISGPAQSKARVLNGLHHAWRGHVENIARVFEEYSLLLSVENLNRKARKDYELYFQCAKDQNRIHFLALKEAFLLLREFNRACGKEWRELSTEVSRPGAAMANRPLFNELSSAVDSALALCGGTDKLVRAISQVLQIPESDVNAPEKEIRPHIVYHDSLRYGLEVLWGVIETPSADYATGTDELLDLQEGSARDEGAVTGMHGHGTHETEPVEKQEEDGASGEMKAEAEGSAGAPTSPSGESPEARPGGHIAVPEIKFTVRGNSTWNTKEPYVPAIHRERLERDYEDLGRSFYFIRSPEEAVVPEGAVKRAMIRHLSDQSRTIEPEYAEFVFKSIITLVQELQSFFKFEGDLGALFVYHSGPVTLHRQLVGLYQHHKYGFCYKHAPGNRVVRYLPTEYLKEKTARWHEENINCLTLEFDRIQLFHEIRRTVSQRYEADLDRCHRETDELIAKFKLDEDKRFDRNEFFKGRWNDCFGAVNIAVYNRFVDRSIFRQ
jgi:hypothetical protein